jgi:hypothetical protein
MSLTDTPQREVRGFCRRSFRRRREAKVPLTIYRRHGKKCPYYRKARDARNNRACQSRCSIWVQGSLGGEYIRRALDLTYWEAAVDLIRSWEAAGRIGRRAHQVCST